ncbi:SDR family oxidoreductase [Saprospiraceae bacterium]|nr:SDR family oxidoreductase [Saprospiraceae bacterium]MDC3253815.1 SDR family oxidoreductase [bacterium]
MKNTALITGASGGIGKELATIHAERGGDLILVARREDKLNAIKTELEKKHGVQVIIIAKDLSVVSSAREIFNEVESKGIQIDFLMNNAGFGLRGKFHELSWERQLEMINLNMVVLTELMYLFLPSMVTRNNGKILNTSSTAGFMPGPLQAVYYASKAYVTFLSNAVAEELHETNVTVTALLPGATDTEFAKTSGMDKTSLFNKAASARSVAEGGYSAMLKGKLDVIAGMPRSQKMMMALLPFFPKKMLLVQTRKMQEVK